MDEVAALDHAIRALEGGVAHALLLSGEPGIGKTRLLDELERLAREAGHLVLAGRASELEGDLPYSIFVDALDEHLRSLGAERLGRIDQGLGVELARMFPAFAGLTSDFATVLDERYRAHAATRELLERLAVESPLVLVLDDLHWADGASIDLLGALLRHPPQASVLLAIGMRPRQASPRLAAALGQAAKTGALERIEVRALPEADARRLVDSAVAPHVWRALYEESGGNPLYIEQLARNLTGLKVPTPITESSRPNGRLEEREDPPRGVNSAFASELDLLSSPARTLLDGAAIVGDPFELDLAAAAAGTTAAETLKGLDELERRDLVRAGSAPRRFRFRHPLVRQAVLETTPSGWRLEAHRRAEHALAQRGEGALVRAPHVEQFAERGDRDAIALLREASVAATERAPASAARWYRAALNLLPESGAEEERKDLLVALATVSAGNGQFDESRSALLEAIAISTSAAEGRPVELIGACARVEHLLGRQQEARARLTSSFERLPDHGSADAAALMIQLATDAFFHAEYDRMKDWATRALATAGPLGRAPLTAAASAMTSIAFAFMGQITEAEMHRADAASIVDSLADDDLAVRLDAIANLGTAEMYLDRYREAAAHLDRGLDVGRATGQGSLFPLLTQVRGTALFMLGRLGESADVLDGSIEAARLTGNPYTIVWALMNRSWTAVFAGEIEAALEMAGESVELVNDLEKSFLTAYATAHMGLALIEAREPARGLELLVPAVGGPGMPLIGGMWRVVLQEGMTRAFLALGQRADAELSASRAETQAEALGLNLARAMALRARAAVALSTRDTTVAAQSALDAASAADAIHVPVEAARARILAGRALTAAGDRHGAVAELERAAAVLDACGAVRLRDQAERGLRRLGRRFERTKPARPQDAVGALTSRELEVAELVRKRMTNREVAAELFLSEKTVETHLRNIFGKLGVSSRASVGRVLESAI